MRYLLVWIAWSAWAQSDAMQASLEKQRAASAIQREAVRKQAELCGLKPLQRMLTAPQTEPAPEPPTPPAPPQTPTPKPTGN